MFNHEAGKNFRWDLNGDRKVSLKEANNWYRNGNGEPIDVSAHSLIVLDLENRDIVVGEDFLVYGQVSLSPSGGIYPDTYNFEMHDGSNIMTQFRNFETLIGSPIAGEGTPYQIRFYNKPTVIHR